MLEKSAASTIESHMVGAPENIKSAVLSHITHWSSWTGNSNYPTSMARKICADHEGAYHYQSKIEDTIREFRSHNNGAIDRLSYLAKSISSAVMSGSLVIQMSVEHSGISHSWVDGNLVQDQ